MRNLGPFDVELKDGSIIHGSLAAVKATASELATFFIDESLHPELFAYLRSFPADTVFDSEDSAFDKFFT